MKSLCKYILPICTLISLYLYEKSTLANVAITSVFYGEEEVISSTIILILFVLMSISTFFMKGIMVVSEEGRKLKNSLVAFLVYVYILSVSISLFVPFQSRIRYFAIGLPLLSFMVVQRFLRVHRAINILYGIVVLFFLLSYQYLINYNIVHAAASDTSSNNSSYFLLYLLPFLLCIEKKYLKWMLIFIVVIAVLSSFKRGGTIAVFASLLVYYYVNNIKLTGGSSKILYLLLLLFTVFIVVSFLNSTDNLIIEHLSERFINIKNDNGSGRSETISEALLQFTNSDVISMLFGHGWNMVEQTLKSGISAHNDFIECLYDFGIIGFILLLRVLFAAYKYLKSLIANRSIYAAPFAASCTIFMLNTMVSHILIYPYYLLLFMAFISFVIYSSSNTEHV